MEEVEAGYLLDFPALNELCANILEELRTNNPGIPLPVRVFVSRDPSPNARCLGDGTLLIHMGLIRRMHNESQLAFVISHELAHYVLDHVNQKLISYSIKATDRVLEKEVNRMMTESDDPFTTLLSYLEGEAYQTHRHSRDRETEADSLGLKLLLNTSYAPEGAIGCMKVLQEVDSPKYHLQVDYQRLLGNLEHPFDENWLIYTPSNNFVYGTNGGDLDWELDSLATHPDCDLRLANLRRQLANRPIDETKSTSVSPLFEQLETAIDLEWLLGYFHHMAYGRTLYLAFQLTEIYPDEPALYSIIGQTMYEIYQSKKAHDLGFKIEFPNPLREPAYNEFLNFARSLRLSDWADYCLQFMMAQNPAFQKDEVFMYTTLLCASIQKDTEIFDTLRQAYYDQFAGGEYNPDVEALNKMVHE